MGELTDVAWRALLVVGLLGLSTVAWWVHRRASGHFHRTGARRAAHLPTATPEGLHHTLGTRATFLQFSAPTCSTCPQVARVLGALAADEPGVEHVELDVEETMDLVRRYGVHRTPTVLLLGPDGVVRSRTSGPLTAGDAREALAHHLPPSPSSPRSTRA